MKNLSLLLAGLALAGVIALFVMRTPGDKAKSTAGSGPEKVEMTTDTKGRIAYVDIDTLKAQYEYYKVKKADFETRQKAMSNELERSSRQFEQDYINAERKAQAGTMSQAEYEATGKRLQQMKQSLESREAALTNKLLEEQNEFNKDVMKRLDDFLLEYNKDKQFDYILSYSKELPTIMLVNPALNITADVVAGMNEKYKESAGKDIKKENK